MQSISLLAGLGQKELYTTAPVTATFVATALQPGTCTADGVFIWDITADGTGFWRRRAVGEVCKATSSEAVDVREHAAGEGGGRTVTETPSLRTYWDQLTRLNQRRAARDIKRYIALAPSLPPCPASAADGPNGLCYSRSPMPSIATMLMAPGSFEYAGVPFHISELAKEGRFDKGPFVPDAEQRQILDTLIAAASWVKLAGSEKNGNFIPNEWNGSIRKRMKENPDIRLHLDGYGLNPVQPTPEEVDGDDGWMHWLDRGGYPLSAEIAGGRAPLKVTTDRIGIPVCASIECACPQDNSVFDAWRQAGYIDHDQIVTSIPRCIGATITDQGIRTTVSVTSGGWKPYVALDGAGQYYLSLIWDGPPWFEKAAAAVGTQLRELAMMLCGNQSVVNEQTSNKGKETCVDKNQAPCTKGAMGCTCTTATNTEKQSIGSFNAWMAAFCAVVAAADAAQTKPPVYEAPTPQVPESFNKTAFPWGLVIAGGVAALGVTAFLLRP